MRSESILIVNSRDKTKCWTIPLSAHSVALDASLCVFPCCMLLLPCYYLHKHTTPITSYLLEHLPVVLSLILLTDHLPRPETVSVGEPHSCILKHLIQGIHPWVQWRHQLFGGIHGSVRSLRAKHRVGLYSLSSFLFWAVEATISFRGPAEDVGGQEGDEGIEPHHDVEKEHQHGIQVLPIQLHLGEAVMILESNEDKVRKRWPVRKRSYFLLSPSLFFDSYFLAIKCSQVHTLENNESNMALERLTFNKFS